MFHRFFVFAFIFLYSYHISFGEQPCRDYAHPNDKVCGTDSLFIEALKDPKVQAKRAKLESFTEHYINNRLYEKEKGVKIIPVVFHVIHNYGHENVSKAQILDALNIVNEDFRKQNSDITDVVSAFQGIAGDSQIEFRLARKDPDGNCTEGITRTASPLTYEANDNVKDLIVWNTNRYLNIWVVDKISFGAGGYCYLPGAAPHQNYRGIVLVHTQLGSIGTSHGTNFAARTLTHEIGHFFNLLHTWGSSNTPGSQLNCYDDDEVSDTPNTVGTLLTCNLTQNTCGSLDNVQNFMDYATCSRMFTNGQIARMQAALSSAVGGRSYLWQHNNLVFTGTNDGYSSTSCPPIADFRAQEPHGCVGTSLSFYDESYNADVDGSWSWSWSFPGATPATSTSQNPSVTYNTAGQHSVTLTVSNASGSNTKTKSNYINIMPVGGGKSVPLFEGFEYSGFPNHQSNPSKNWSFEGSTSAGWGRSTMASYSGEASLRINNFMLPEGSVHSFISPNIDMNFIEAPITLTFMLAYARRNASSNDRLRILVSDDCGYSWMPRYLRTSAGLVSNTGGNYVSGNFIPTASEWKQETVNLALLANSLNTLIKFEMTSDGGNFLYIDDINLVGVVGINDGIENKPSFEVFPNPLSYDSYISLNTTSTSEYSKIYFYDVVGHVIASKNLGQLGSGPHNIKIRDIVSNLAPGVYFIKLYNGSYNATEKVIVTTPF